MRGRTRVVGGRARHLSVCVSVWKPGSSKYVGGVHTEQLVPLRLSAIHANKERCPTMHFPSVVHLAPRRNDLFDVYSRSLTLIKITASPRFASLFFFLFFLSLSRALFFGVLSLISPPSFVLPFVVPKDSPQGMGTEPPSEFSLFTLCRTLVFGWKRSLLLFRAWKLVRIQGVSEIMVQAVILYARKQVEGKELTFFSGFCVFQVNRENFKKIFKYENENNYLSIYNFMCENKEKM